MRLNKDVHKNDFGHVLVLAGSPSMLGAAALTGLAAMRSGAGLTTVAVAKSLNLTLQKKISPVIMTLPLPETKQGALTADAIRILRKNWSQYSAVAIGPGLPVKPDTARYVKSFYQTCPLPMVVDASALQVLAGNLQQPLKSAGARVLTPHPGEMAKLTGLIKTKIEADRRNIAARFARQWHCVVVLKGHRTIVASPNGQVVTNTSGNSGMATAGSGDVLTGIIAALLGQGLPPFESARFGVWWHGKAGDLAARNRNKCSLIATDIIEKLSEVGCR